MSKSLLQNVSEGRQLVDMETEELAGYVLEHLHANGGNSLTQGNSLPHNLANALAPSYPQNFRDQVYKRILAACHWLINNGYLDIINAQGFYEISKKGNKVTTASDLIAQLTHSTQSPRPDSTQLDPETAIKRKTFYRFPKIELSEPELMWLQIISKQFLSGYLADVDRLKKSLHAQGKWPRNFRPSEIDYRLFQRENIPTLLGIWHADPESAWIAKLDELVRYVKAKLPATSEIKVADIAEALGIPQINASILIHLLPSLGFSYTAIGTPTQHARVVIPGRLGMYDVLKLDDPEKMDRYLEFEDLEKQLRNFYGEQEYDANQSGNAEALALAERLYEKTRTLIGSVPSLDENTARIVVESADDAIKEFGSTNQEKKIELRNWKTQAELALPPSTIEELRKRAEGHLLKGSYPSNPILQKSLLIGVVLVVIVGGALSLRRALSNGPQLPNHQSIPPTPSNQESPEGVEAMNTNEPFIVELLVLKSGDRFRGRFGIGRGTNPDGTPFYVLNYVLEEKGYEEFVDRVNIKVNVADSPEAQDLANQGINLAQRNLLAGPIFSRANALSVGTQSDAEIERLIRSLPNIR